MRTLPCHHARALVAVIAAAAMPAAHAGDDRAMPRDVPAAYAQECASCHVAYPPGMLPARSWQRVMAGLGKHYGVDASIDAATARSLGGWLQANAGTWRGAAAPPPQDRITRSAWFGDRHRELSPAVWKLASVRSASNCGACHAGAERGDFDDDGLSMPAGLDRRSRSGRND